MLQHSLFLSSSLEGRADILGGHPVFKGVDAGLDLPLGSPIRPLHEFLSGTFDVVDPVGPPRSVGLDRDQVEPCHMRQ